MPSAHYRLTEDIDVAAIQWSDSVFPSFSGSFDGGGFSISNLVITGRENIGLFGIVESGFDNIGKMIHTHHQYTDFFFPGQHLDLPLQQFPG